MSFAKVRGQERAVERLSAALQGGRLAHAYLLTGPEGVGKRTLARALAKAAACETGRETGDACGRCASCRAMESGNSFDFNALLVEEGGEKGRARDSAPFGERQPAERKVRPVSDEDREIKIGSIRMMEREMFLKSASGRTRAFLIPGAERMNEEAANALLKTLEEPPPGRLLILTAARPEALLPTVLSRVARVRLRSLSAREVEDCLVEEHGKLREEARELAWAANGSIGAALAGSVEKTRRAREFVTKTWAGGRLPEPLALSDAMLEFAGGAAGSKDRTAQALGRELLALWGLVRGRYRGALLSAAGAGGEEAAEALAELGPERLARALGAQLEADRAVRGYDAPEHVCRVLAGELSAAGR